jgi:hypothetical protein
LPRITLRSSIRNRLQEVPFMEDEEYDAFLRYLFEEHIQPRLPLLISRRLHHFEDEFGWSLERLRHAKQILNHIRDLGPRQEDPYRIFTAEALATAIGDVESGVRFHNTVAEASGVLDALDAHFDALCAGLRPEHLPTDEAQILTSLGFPELAQHLPGIVYMVSSDAQRGRYGTKELPVSSRLSSLVERLDRVRKEHNELAEMARQPEKERPREPPQRKPRRWFKGLGQIAQGAVMSIADIAVAAGALHLPISPETRTWGMLASATAGVGTLLSGVGDLRGE